MPRRFNTAGPCDPARHYMISASARLPALRRLVDDEAYFVVHAPRQIGKTTSLLSFAQELTREGTYLGVLVSMEVGAAFPGDIGAAELAILESWRDTASWQLPADLQPPAFEDAPPGARIGGALRAWAAAASRPLVIFLDAISSGSSIHGSGRSWSRCWWVRTWAMCPKTIGGLRSIWAWCGVGRRAAWSLPIRSTAR